MTIKEASQKFIEWGSVKYSIYTLRNYRQYLNVFIKFHKNKLLKKLELEDVISFQKFLKDKGNKDNTIALYTASIAGMVRLMFLQGKSKLNPELIPFPKVVNESWKPAEEEHLKEILKVLWYEDLFIRLRNELIVKFLFSSGVRNSELCDLTLDVLNLKNQEAIITTKKNLKKRVIMWDNETDDIMIKYLDERLKYEKSEYLFISREGYRLCSRQIQRIVKELRKKAGIKERIVPHSFRHGFANRGVSNNCNLEHLRILLGHLRLNSTQIYFAQSDQEVRKTYQEVYNK